MRSSVSRRSPSRLPPPRLALADRPAMLACIRASGEAPSMTGPADEIAGQSRFRASHADREQVVGALQAAFVQGRLTTDELDERVGQALAARTYADLAALTADLPAGPERAPAPVPTPPPVPVRRPPSPAASFAVKA